MCIPLPALWFIRRCNKKHPCIPSSFQLFLWSVEEEQYQEPLRTSCFVISRLLGGYVASSTRLEIYQWNRKSVRAFRIRNGASSSRAGEYRVLESKSKPCGKEKTICWISIFRQLFPEIILSLYIGISSNLYDFLNTLTPGAEKISNRVGSSVFLPFKTHFRLPLSTLLAKVGPSYIQGKINRPGN